MEEITVPGLVDTPEEHLLDNGEYLFNTRNFSYTELGDDDLPAISGMLVAQGEADASPVYHTIFLPKEGDDEEQQKRSDRNLRRFLSAVGVSWDDDGKFVVADINDKEAMGKARQKVNKKSQEREVKVTFPRQRSEG